ncbi:MAG: alcohol dehydrogenase catalytic domain-containing protein [Methanosarcinales archaeon]|nr:alcohol dehydrogenase catalytic domain-containing protein [Methanosarcinales archaeon]
MSVQAAVLTAPGRLELREMPAPDCPPGGALVRVHSCSVCGTDVKMLERGHRDLSYPRVLGHEIAGRIDQVDESESDLSPGDPVQVWPGLACGVCRPCRRGQDNQCESMGILGFNRDGGYAELVALPRESLVRGLCRLKRGADLSLASLAEPLACCINGQELTGVGPLDQVLVLGGGPIGCLHALLARRRGAEKVLLAERLPGRIRMAERRGQSLADRVIDTRDQTIRDVVAEETGGRGVDVILPATPEIDVDCDMLGLLAPRGRISLFSGPRPGSFREVMDIRTMHYRDLMLVGAYGSTSRQNRVAAEMISSREIDVRWLITMRTDLGGVGKALEHAMTRAGMKAVICR